jgi:hypothetical protein
MILSTGQAREQVSHPETRLICFGSVSSERSEFNNKELQGE